MSHTAAEVLAGAGVLAVGAAFAFYAAQGTGLTGRDAGSYPLSASFRSVEGITVGSDVRLAGVKVGTITALTLNPQTFMADAKIAISEGILLPEDSAILISSEGLLGGNFVEILPGGAVETLPPGAEIEDTQGAVSLITLLMKFVAGDESADPAAGASPAATEPGAAPAEPPEEAPADIPEEAPADVPEEAPAEPMPEPPVVPPAKDAAP